MNDQRILFLGVAALAAFFVVSRAKAQAAAPAGIRAPVKMPTKGTITNMNGNMWGSLLGDSLSAMVSPDTGKSLFGVNGFGQWVTADGKPVSSDTANQAATSMGLIPTDNIGGEEYMANLFPGLGY